MRSGGTDGQSARPITAVIAAVRARGTRLADMRVARLLSMLLAVLTTGLLCAPGVAAEPPFRIPDYVTDESGVLTPGQREDVEAAVSRLYEDERIRLWVVYVDTFGQSALGWARTTMQLSDFGDRDALLAVATAERAYAFQVPPSIMSQSRASALQRDAIEPALRRDDWAGAAVAASDGMTGSSTGSGSGVSWVALLIMAALLAVAVFVLWLWTRRRRRKRKEAEFAAARRVDPSDPNALASVPIDALDDLSKSIVVDVDNAVRTSESELALAVEEFGASQTEPFTRAVGNARTALAQAFNVRQILDDAVPETPQQRRDLLTRVVVAAAKADRELDTQSEAFENLRDLIINAPTRLDALTQQMVDLTARLEPSEQALAALHNQFDPAALASVADNPATARERLSFADRSMTNARALVARPTGQQMGLVDAIRAAESSLGQARSLLDAVDRAGTDINRAVSALPSAIADIQNGIAAAATQLQQGTTAQKELETARDAAAKAVDDAQRNGATDPLGTFTRLTKADADLDRLLASVAEERAATERMSRAYDQALLTAQSRVRGGVGFHRHPTRQYRARGTHPPGRSGPPVAGRPGQEGDQPQRGHRPRQWRVDAGRTGTVTGQRRRACRAADLHLRLGRYGGGGSGSDMGAVIGGIIIGNILGGAMRGGFGGGSGAASAVVSVVGAARDARRPTAARRGRRAAATAAAVAASRCSRPAGRGGLPQAKCRRSSDFGHRAGVSAGFTVGPGQSPKHRKVAQCQGPHILQGSWSESTARSFPMPPCAGRYARRRCITSR